MPLPILLVHGLFGSLDMPALHAGLAPHPVLAPDLPGYGALRHTPAFVVTLENQAGHLRDYLDAAEINRVHLVGHSVGGAVAMLFAHKYSRRVASLTLAEGNLTLADAFWSADIARRTLPEVERILDEMRADPAGWLRKGGIETNPENLAIATDWLHRQPASTILRTAKAVVWTTASEAYAGKVAQVMERIPVHLVAGERPRKGWNVPDRVAARAASERTIAGAGPGGGAGRERADHRGCRTHDDAGKPGRLLPGDSRQYRP